jgi:hypothetical protein
MVCVVKTWDERSEFFWVGERFCPAGIVAARQAVRAKFAGDESTMLLRAVEALDSDSYANAERAHGRVCRRSNVVGNAWSGWFEAITGRASGW